MDHLDLHLFLHGLIILLSGLLGGIPFARAILKKDNEVAWRVVHAGGSMGGIMLIAIGGLILKLNTPLVISCFLAWGIIIATYAFVIGMILAAVSNERGLDSMKTSTVSKLIRCLYSAGTFLSLISIFGFISVVFISIYF